MCAHARAVKISYNLRILRILLNCIEVLLIPCTNARARVEVKERKRRKEVEVKKKWWKKRGKKNPVPRQRGGYAPRCKNYTLKNFWYRNVTYEGRVAYCHFAANFFVKFTKAFVVTSPTSIYNSIIRHTGTFVTFMNCFTKIRGTRVKCCYHGFNKLYENFRNFEKLIFFSSIISSNFARIHIKHGKRCPA